MKTIQQMKWAVKVCSVSILASVMNAAIAWAFAMRNTENIATFLFMAFMIQLAIALLCVHQLSVAWMNLLQVEGYLE